MLAPQWLWEVIPFSWIEGYLNVASLRAVALSAPFPKDARVLMMEEYRLWQDQVEADAYGAAYRETQLSEPEE